MNEFRIFLIAQPNSGKTTLFNRLTGEKCYVANWPGKTVEVFQGKIRHHDKEILLVDLPGINSFKTLGKEEELTKEFLFAEEGVAIVLLNGESLYRSLYFAVQILEVRKNVLLAINKLDAIERKGVHVNVKSLSERLGVDVVQISALKGFGINQLLDRALDILEKRKKTEELRIDYGVLESYVKEAEKILENRGLAVKALEGDEYVISLLSKEKRAAVEAIRKEIETRFAKPEEIIAMQRHKLISEMIRAAVEEVNVATKSFEEKIDSIFFSRFGSIFTLLILISVLFFAFTLNTGFPMNFIFSALGLKEIAEFFEKYSISGLLGIAVEMISNSLNSFLPESWIKSLIIDGIVAGIGALATFFPLIFLVNFLMSLLEDSGVMARMAVSMNKLFSIFGLTGKSVFPFGINLGCNVPGISASRILETDAERIRVAIASPFVICQARLLVIVILVSAFIASPVVQSITVIMLYLTSTSLFLLISKLYAKFSENEVSELLLELPPYHIPSLRVTWWITWSRSKAFITKIGTFLLLFAVIIWAINYFAFGELIGGPVAKIFSPFGFEHWQIGFSIIVGFFAKELIIESLAISYGTADMAQVAELMGLTISQTIGLLFFISFYTPCAAAIAALYSELKSSKLLLVSVVAQILIAYLITLIAFSVASLL
ncbi:MAG: ferrous iron transport protein B [Archaeoglobaceae archaeon]